MNLGRDEEVGDNAPVKRSKPKGDFWFKAANLSELGEKRKKAIITASGRALMLWLVDGRAYCTDATSTAYSFPLIDASIETRDGSPAIVVPLDGTTYNLKTGEVLDWCPKNNPLRQVLSVLKQTTTPVPLPVFDCVLTYDDEIYVKLTKSLTSSITL